MEFNELKEQAQRELKQAKLDFLPDSPDTLNIGYPETGPTQRLIFSVSQFRGKKFFDIRTWYQEDSGQWKPTKKGVHLSFDKFNDFSDAVALFKPIINLDK